MRLSLSIPARLALFSTLLAPSLHAAPVPLPDALRGDYTLEAPPAERPLVLRQGDRLALCGDSITEQKQYSVLIETYLAACTPELEIECRQFGWSGEQLGGFLGRFEQDVLRFKPTVVTTCYGMNDFRYVPFDPAIGNLYLRNLDSLAQRCRAVDTTLVIGSPGIIDSVPHWVQSASGTQLQLNQSLARFRNLALEAANNHRSRFADVYTPMLLADLQAKQRFGPEFKVAGKDGVHPGWAGQTVMAYAFLHAFGLDGNLAAFTLDAATGKATATPGHEVVKSTADSLTLRSSRLPFVPGPGAADSDDSIQAGLGLVPFHDQLNRFTFRIENLSAPRYRLTWGNHSQEFSAAELAAGIHLPARFPDNPLVPAFRKVMDAVGNKQSYETRQIKTLVHGPEGHADLEATFALTEKARATLVRQLRESLQPAEHTLTLAPLP